MLRPAARTATVNGRPCAGNIVVLLRRIGPSSPDQLAVRLGASQPASYNSCEPSRSAELVMRRTERLGVGRPRHLYDVSRGPRISSVELRRRRRRPPGGDREVGGGDLMDEIFVAPSPVGQSDERPAWPSGCRQARRWSDRVRELAVIGRAGLPGSGRDRARRDDPPGRAQLRDPGGRPASSGRARPNSPCSARVLDADVVRDIATGDGCYTYQVVARDD